MQVEVISSQSACNADKAGGVSMPGDQNIVYTHTDANIVALWTLRS